MGSTDRIQALVRAKLEEHRAVLEAAPDLNSVSLIVQLDRFGEGRDKVVIRTESGHLTHKR